MCFHVPFIDKYTLLYPYYLYSCVPASEILIGVKKYMFSVGSCYYRSLIQFYSLLSGPRYRKKALTLIDSIFNGVIQFYIPYLQKNKILNKKLK